MRWFIFTPLLLIFVFGCEKSDSSTASTDANTKLILQLNWKPEPQFGGFYAAQLNGAYAKHGGNIEVVPGGVGTPTVQMVAAGKVAFGVVSADEIIIARSNGADVVGLFAVYQTNPQGLMTHAARGLNGIEDIFTRDGILAIQKGLPYATFLETKYGFGKVRVVPSPGGDLSAFRNDPNFTMQCFVTSEPLAAKKAGLDARTFLIAEAGYNPYTTVLATTQAMIKSNPKAVKDAVQAVQEGWQAYLSDPVKTNELMGKLNSAMDLATFAESAEAQKTLIIGESTIGADLGRMSIERWRTLVSQLANLKVIEKPVLPEECFVDVTKLP